MYGATLAEVIIRQHHGRAWLIIDQVVWDRALAQSMGSASATDVDESLHEDQRLQANQSRRTNELNCCTTYTQWCSARNAN